MATYVDLDISLSKHPGTNDVLKKTDNNAIRFALRNLFLTNPGEVMFNPNFGIGIRDYLFENFSPAFRHILKRKCIEQLSEFEPRAAIDDIQISEVTDKNECEISIYFHTVANPQPQSLNLVVERVR